MKINHMDDQPIILVAGKFDGLHRGHQQLIQQAKSYVTPDDQLAIWDLADEQPVITSLDDKLHILEGFGTDRYYDSNVQLQKLHCKRIVIEEDMEQELANHCNPHDLPVTILPHTTLNHERIHAASIQSFVEKGKMEAAQALIGRPFQTTGTVVRGDALGRQLGFPTLNLGGIEEYVEPKPGVYLGVVEVHSETSAYYYTLISAGYRPTVNGQTFKVEAYLMNFSGDLYGEKVTVSYLRHMRDEENFDGVDVLVEQMKQDEQKARAILGMPFI
ncbi:riboflavin biosynthesis protein RibF [Halobacillus shinanisalinarum]|uniref:Riboflavin biosynthesis protein n=1 Tax=Halobacillus shinanisalinarum TaxID=2932258 RepID=A0ABY4GUN4_9BACI|nr:riboflavin kinase [Halobacillus shinanisalinarum]UOQ91605.1 riboflavin biosynthesis protein RibF [Halobacillus shinanisalinarum]